MTDTNEEVKQDEIEATPEEPREVVILREKTKLIFQVMEQAEVDKAFVKKCEKIISDAVEAVIAKIK